MQAEARLRRGGLFLTEIKNSAVVLAASAHGVREVDVAAGRALPHRIEILIDGSKPGDRAVAH